MPQQQTVNYLVSGGVDATNAVAVGKSIAADLATKAGFSTDALGNVTGLVGPNSTSYAIGSKLTGMTALQAISQAKTRRVDIVMLGDSNQQYSGTGFTAGLDWALGQKFQCYATGIVPGYATSYWGYLVSTVDESNLPASPTLIAGKASTVFSGGFGVTGATPGYLSTGAPGTGMGGVGLSNGAMVGVNNALTAWFAQWLDTSFTGGSIGPGVRLESSPYTVLATTTAVSTQATSPYGRVGMQSVSIPANSAGSGNLGFRWACPGGATATGPFQTLYARVENPNATYGYSTHTLYSAGGTCAYGYAMSLINTPDQTLTTFFAETRRLQISKGLSPLVVIYINSGLNDRNNSWTPSLGPSEISGTGSSAAEYVDNLRAIQNRIKYIWNLNNWNLGELHWLFCPSHRIADPDDSQLLSYRSAIIAATANDLQTSCIDLGALMTQAQGIAGGWYATGQNYIHLTDVGYHAISQLIVAQTP